MGEIEVERGKCDCKVHVNAQIYYVVYCDFVKNVQSAFEKTTYNHSRCKQDVLDIVLIITRE